MATCKNCIHYEMCQALEEGNGILKIGPIHCGYFKDQSLFVETPVKIGDHLWRVTFPYRQDPKVTEFVVKNFRTVGKKHKLMLEVQALNVPGTNVMHISAFKRTREEAEKELEALK